MTGLCQLTGKEETMTAKGRNILGYIKHLQKARDGIEKKQDEMMSPVPPESLGAKMTEMARLEAEFITLGVLIRDLELMDNVQEFSYWDV